MSTGSVDLNRDSEVSRVAASRHACRDAGKIDELPAGNFDEVGCESPRRPSRRSMVCASTEVRRWRWLMSLASLLGTFGRIGLCNCYRATGLRLRLEEVTEAERHDATPEQPHQGGILKRRPSFPSSWSNETTSLGFRVSADVPRGEGRSVFSKEMIGWIPRLA